MYTCIYYVYIDNIILYIHPCNFHPFLRPRPRHLRRFGEETHRGSARGPAARSRAFPAAGGATARCPTARVPSPGAPPGC